MKKQLKKKLEKKFNKKKIHRKQVINHSIQPNLELIESLPTKQNNLRAQLLARAALFPHLGYFPQQYGNRSINNLQSNAELLIKKINDDSMRIKALETENESRKNKLSDLDKERRKLEAEDNDLQKQYLIAKDNLEMKKRIDSRREVIKYKLRNINEQLTGNEGDSDLLKAKKKLNQRIDQNEELKLSNMQLKGKISANEIYGKAERVKKENEARRSEREALLATLGSDEFNHPEKYLKEQYEEQVKLDRQIKFLKKDVELKDEANRMRAYIALQPKKEDIDKEDKQLTGDIQKQLAVNAELERNIDEEKAPIERLKVEKKEYIKDRQEEYHLQNELLKTKEEAKYISTHPIKRKNLNQPLKIGVARAQLDRENQKLDHIKQINKSKFEKAVIEGEEKELDKPFSKDEQDTIDREGEEEAKLQQAKDEKESKIKAKKARREAKAAKASINYTKSPEYTETEAKITQNIIDTEDQMKQKQKYDILNKANEHLARAEAEEKIAEIHALNPVDASSITQLTAIDEGLAKLNEAKTNQINQINNSIAQKKSIIDAAYKLEDEKFKKNMNETLDNFIVMHSVYQTVLKDYSNMSLDFLNKFYQDYKAWHFTDKDFYDENWPGEESN